MNTHLGANFLSSILSHPLASTLLIVASWPVIAIACLLRPHSIRYVARFLFPVGAVLCVGMTALLWTHLNAAKADLEPTVIGLAFVFLLVGYGTKVGLAPLHNWLPDAHAEGPTPVSAVLSGLLLNVALYAVIRCKVLAVGSIGPLMPGRMLMAFGLLSAVLAAFFLWRQRDIKRLFGYSSIEHMDPEAVPDQSAHRTQGEKTIQHFCKTAIC